MSLCIPIIVSASAAGLIRMPFCQVGRVKRRSVAVAGAAASLFRLGVGVSLSTRVSLICAGWLPQDGTFESEGDRLSRVESDHVV